MKDRSHKVKKFKGSCPFIKSATKLYLIMLMSAAPRQALVGRLVENNNQTNPPYLRIAAQVVRVDEHLDRLERGSSVRLIL